MWVTWPKAMNTHYAIQPVSPVEAFPLHTWRAFDADTIMAAKQSLQSVDAGNMNQLWRKNIEASYLYSCVSVHFFVFSLNGKFGRDNTETKSNFVSRWYFYQFE